MTILRKALLLVIVAAFCGLPLAAQLTDCAFTFSFTTDANQAGVSNLSGHTPCVNWRITYSVTGTLASTVTFQTSPDNITFTSVPNTLCSASVQPPCVIQGTNPLTGTTQGMSYFAAYGSYVRVITSSSSGTGTGTVRGYGSKGATANTGIPGATGAQGPAGAAGAAGAAGPGYLATSTTSLTIGTGSTAFTTQAGLAYTTGARARASSQADGTNYMEGLVTAYTGTTLTINVTVTGGSGTHADWDINLAGNVGATGATGPAGAAGAALIDVQTGVGPVSPVGAALTTIASKVVTGGTIKAGGCLHVEGVMTHTGGADAISYRIYYSTGNIVLSGSTINADTLGFSASVCNDAGVTNAQHLMQNYALAALVNPSSSVGTSAIDSTTNQTLALKVVCVGGCTSALTLQNWTVSVINP